MKLLMSAIALVMAAECSQQPPLAAIQRLINCYRLPWKQFLSAFELDFSLLVFESKF